MIDIEAIKQRIAARKLEILLQQQQNNWCDLEGAYHKALGELDGLNFALMAIGEEE